MLKPKLSAGGWKLLRLIVLSSLFTLSGTVADTSFQSSQYSQYSTLNQATPSYHPYPDSKNVAVSADPNGHAQDPVISQPTIHQPVVQAVQQSPQAYYYETYPMQDSSRHNKRCTVGPNGHMRCYSRQDTTGSDYDTTGATGGGAAGGGLAGLAGLLGLFGLKGLKALTGVITPILFPLLFPLLLPILLPILLPLLLLLLVPLLLLPVPVITIPQGRSLETEFSAARKMASNTFQQIISSDECVERVSCEISRMSQGRKAGEWVEKAMGFLPEKNPLTKRIHKGYNMFSVTADVNPEGKQDMNTICKRLKCKMFTMFESPTGRL